MERAAAAAFKSAGEGRSPDLRSLGINRPSSTWTYQVEEESLPGFNLGSLASANIGAAVTEAALLLILKAGGFCAGLVKGLWGRLRGG